MPLIIAENGFPVQARLSIRRDPRARLPTDHTHLEREVRTRSERLAMTGGGSVLDRAVQRSRGFTTRGKEGDRRESPVPFSRQGIAHLPSTGWSIQRIRWMSITVFASSSSKITGAPSPKAGSLVPARGSTAKLSGPAGLES